VGQSWCSISWGLGQVRLSVLHTGSSSTGTRSMPSTTGSSLRSSSSSCIPVMRTGSAVSARHTCSSTSTSTSTPTSSTTGRQQQQQCQCQGVAGVYLLLLLVLVMRRSSLVAGVHLLSHSVHRRTL
jgi:hypothetical protein